MLIEVAGARFAAGRKGEAEPPVAVRTFPQVGTPLTLQQQLIAVAIMMLTSKGTAGIAGGAFIVLASTISAIGMVPVASLALIVGIDRMLNEGRVFINVLGNAIAAIVIGKWEGDFDHERASAILNSRQQPAEFHR